MNVRGSYEYLDEVLEPNFGIVYIGANIENRLTVYKKYINENNLYNYMIKGNTEFDYGFDASYNFEAVGKTNSGETVGTLDYSVSIVEFDENRSTRDVSNSDFIVTEEAVSKGYTYKLKYDVFDKQFPEIKRTTYKYLYPFVPEVNSLKLDVLQYMGKRALCNRHFIYILAFKKIQLQLLVLDHLNQKKHNNYIILSEKMVLNVGTAIINPDGTKGTGVKLVQL